MSANNALSEIAELIYTAAGKKALKKAVFSKPEYSDEIKTVLTPKLIGRRYMLQAETFTKDSKAKHFNFIPEDRKAIEKLAGSHSQINIITAAGECEFRRSRSGKTTVRAGKTLLNALQSYCKEEISPSQNNRSKQYILKGDEPFLILLGISGQNGRVYDKRQAKFRQINKFLEFIKDTESLLPKDKKLVIRDLCCGKSYLTFAVYHYFTQIARREVSMTGVDLKSDVISECSDIARRLHFDSLDFLCLDISEYSDNTVPDMVLSLHACDTATDIVLDKASQLGAKVILSTPCCHHELNRLINCPELSFITEHSMLRQKFCEAATDALRLKKLESEGYKVTAFEFIDPEETPKNIMLKAVKISDSGTPRAKAAAERYSTARKYLLGE